MPFLTFTCLAGLAMYLRHALGRPITGDDLFIIVILPGAVASISQLVEQFNRIRSKRAPRAD
jgi:hypothetical protein